MPPIPEERIRTLIQKYLTDNLTAAEEQELGNLAIKYPRTMEILDQMESEGIASPGFQQRQEEALEKGLAKAHALIYPSEDVPAANPPGKIPVIRRNRTRWMYYGAAAVLLGVVLLGVIFFNPRNGTPGKAPSTPTVASTVTSDIVPGGNKATLTLTDGRTIRLDSLKGGKLPEQEGVSAVLQDSGTLAYTMGNATTIAYNTLTVPRGGQYRVILPDGTKVWLNNVSSLRYPVAFTGNTREVTVTGEAYFEVAKDAGKPFTVKVNDVNVQVLGTAFNISAYTTRDTRAVLLEGSVRIMDAHNSRLLKPGQALATGGVNKWKVITDEHAEESISWTKGVFDFRDVPLSEILKSLAQWYDFEADLKGITRDPRCQLLGLKRNMPLSAVLNILRKEGQIRLEGRKLIAST